MKSRANTLRSKGGEGACRGGRGVFREGAEEKQQQKVLESSAEGEGESWGGINPTVERFFLLPSQEQVDRGKLPLALRPPIIFFPPLVSPCVFPRGEI